MPKKKTVSLPQLNCVTTGTAGTMSGTTLTVNGTSQPNWGNITIPSYYPAPSVELKATGDGVSFSMSSRGGARATINIPEHEIINAMSAISDFLHSKGVNNKITYE